MLPADLRTAEAELLTAVSAALAKGGRARWTAELRFEGLRILPVALRLTAALQLSDSLLQQELPALQTLLTAAQSSEDNLLNGRTAGGLSSWRAPLRAWICQKLNELLNSGSPEQQQQIQERLAGYPEPVLLRLTGVAVADESLESSRLSR